MLNELPDEADRIESFAEALSRMPDHRDNRGKKDLFPEVIIAGSVSATSVGRSTLSAIYR